MISLSRKGGTRARECIECSEKLLFLYEKISRLIQMTKLVK